MQFIMNLAEINNPFHEGLRVITLPHFIKTSTVPTSKSNHLLFHSISLISKRETLPESPPYCPDSSPNKPRDKTKDSPENTSNVTHYRIFQPGILSCRISDQSFSHSIPHMIRVIGTRTNRMKGSLQIFQNVRLSHLKFKSFSIIESPSIVYRRRDIA
jgi:hypothetical protein